MAMLDPFAAFARSVGVGTPGTPGVPAGCSKLQEPQRPAAQGFLDRGTPGTPGTPQKNDAEIDADLMMEFEERAAILEYDEGLPRPEAECLAREQVFGRQSLAA